MQDGLGTVRIETDNSVGVEGSQNLDPFGNLIDMVNGDIDTPYGFTGELVDGSGLLDLRARRYNAGIGVFASLDPFEGMRNRAMSLNGYLYVEGNTPNAIDPSGMSCAMSSPVPPNGSLGCDTIFEAIASGLDKFASRRFSGSIETAITALATSWALCKCNTFKNRNISSVNSQGYYETSRTLQSIRNDLGTLLLPYFGLGIGPAFNFIFSDSTLEPSSCTYSYFETTPDLPMFPPYQPDTHNPRVLTIGSRPFDVTGALGGAFDVNFEVHCAPYYLFGGGERCAWFMNVTGGFNTSGVGASYSAGVVIGLLGWPSQPGSTSFINSVGVGISSPWIKVGPGGDFTWDPNSGDAIKFLGGSVGASVNPAPIGGYVMTGASIYLGPDLFNIPPEVGTAIKSAGSYLLHQHH